MKRFLLFISTYLILCNAESQDISAVDFLFSSSFSPKKFDSYLSKRKFVHTGTRIENDTLVTTYVKKMKKADSSQSILNEIETFQFHHSFSFAYITSSVDEFAKNRKELKSEGFYCGNENDLNASYYLYQKKNITATVTISRTPEDTLYSFKFCEIALPPPDKIQYAEDLVQFYSHEFLVSYFGRKNVIKDLYYFQDKKTSRCSVLFPHTNRQAVFIWEDEINLCKPSAVLVGGNITTAGLEKYDGVVMENIWNSKEGIYSGMSLNDLVKLNGNNFKFYGKNSTFPYMVVPENTGNLDFKRSRVVLGCLNLNGIAILNRPVVSTDEILDYNSSLYVFMLMIMPGDEVNKDSAHR